MNNVWLGIDTSNYTTSVSAFLEDNTFYNIKVPLCVKANEKGVRQSDAVFMHVKNLPVAFDKLMTELKAKGDARVVAVGVSTRPRPVEGSYMPCFLSGVSVASSVAATLKVPLYEFSHQEGHIRAALHGAGCEVPEHFYSFHLSGGTCELLDVTKTEYGFNESLVSYSADITLGQLVDRTGVMMGLQFPCGQALEELASLSREKYKVRIGGDVGINLSGFENKTIKMYNDGASKEDVASYVYSVISAAIEKMLSFRSDMSLPVVYAGGVSGSNIVRKYVEGFASSYFAPSSLSSDNAVGIALLTKEKYHKVCEK